MVTAVTSSVRHLARLVILVLSFGYAPAWAATFTVNSTLDAVDSNLNDGVCVTADSVCTLRAAIQQSNKSLGTPDIIKVPAGTYVLTALATGNLDIFDSVTIEGAGAAQTIIDGGGSDVVMSDNVFSIFGASTIVNISGLTIQNGSVAVNRLGGGIFSTANLTLIDVVVRNNHAGEGGGIYNRGSLTLIRSVVEDNTATLVSFPTFAFRRGGGIHSFGSSLTISDSTIRNNTAVSGGGIFNMGTGIATISTSTISGNTATNVSLNNGNGGGGIVNGGTLAGTMTITNSTVSGNRANGHYGGIFDENGTLTLNSVTLANNVADADNDGFGSGGGLGLSFATGATAVVRNTIIAGNSAAGTTPDCVSLIASALESGGHNLIGNSGVAVDCAFTPSLGDQVGTMANPIAASLKPLADYGGSTFTHALMDSSPAIDAGDPAGCSDGTTSLTTDQRGQPRTSAGGSGAVRCDIGAYELSLPIANAGPDQRVNASAPVTLDGSGSTAASGIASYSWTQTGGDPVSLDPAGSESPSFVAPASAGVLTFQLSIADTFGTTVSDTVDVTVNATPIADAGADRTVSTGTPTSLDGTGSSDTDGSIAYSWVQIGGATTVALTGADTDTPSFVAPASADNLEFQLTVTDNDGATAVDSVVITVSAPVAAPTTTNSPPVAYAGSDKNVRPRSVVFLSGWKSYDRDGRIVGYRWEQTSGPRVKLHGSSWPWAAFVAPRKEATLTFQLTVTDNKGATSTDSVTVTVDKCVKRWYHDYFRFFDKHGHRHGGKHGHGHGHECR